MSKKKAILFFSLLGVFAVIYLLLNNGGILAQKQTKTCEISVICRSENTEEWSTMKLGVDQAAKDLNAEVSFITLSSANNAKEQVSLLDREGNNGADAIIIAPVDSSLLKAPLEAARKKMPVIAMQSTVSGVSGLTTVACDNAAMGRGLAKEINRRESSAAEAVVLRRGNACTNEADCLSGLKEGLKNRTLTCCNLPDDAAQATDTLQTCMAAHRGAVFIALDAQTLETAALMRRSDFSSPHVYGAGRTNKIVSLLEQNSVAAIAVENDYNMGYLSVKAAVDQVRSQSAGSVTINSIVVDRTNMYEPDNERMLFPFVR